MSEQEKTPTAGTSSTGGAQADPVEFARLNLAQAQDSLAKLPILGPALWLYGHDAIRKFTFVGDIDWLLLPPVVLDQCRLFTRAGIPTAFFTWAFVSDAIDQRLRSGGRLSPHEWKSGQHAWFIDMVMPFRADEDLVTELRRTVLAGYAVKTAVQDPKYAGQCTVREWPAVAAESKDASQGH